MPKQEKPQPKKTTSGKPERTAARKARNVKREQAKMKRYAALRWGPDGVSHKTAKNRRRRASQLARAKAARCSTWKQYQRKRQPHFSHAVEVIGSKVDVVNVQGRPIDVVATVAAT